MDGTADSREGPDSGDMDDEPGAGPGGGGDMDVCIICYEASPPPIPSGCACRGPSALAHVACRIRAAEIMGGHRGRQVWSECLTCQQGYTGPVLAGLANAWWTQVRDRPEEDLERLAAAQNLAGSVFQQGDYAEAAAILRGVLGVQVCVCVRIHMHERERERARARSLSMRCYHLTAMMCARYCM